MKYNSPDGGCIFFSHEQLSTELDIFDMSSNFIPDKTFVKCYSPFVILTVYEEPDYYSQFKNSNLNNFHLPGINNPEYRSFYSKLFQIYFTEFHSTSVNQIFLGHEHDIKGYCYLQIFIFFNGLFTHSLSPSSFVINNCNFPLFTEKKFYFLNANPKSYSAIFTYFNRKGDFFYLDNSRTSIQSFISKSNIVDIKENDQFSKPDIPEGMKDKIAIKIEKFKWKRNEKVFKEYPLIEKWFNENVIYGKPGERKALLLYSDMPMVGKTQFAVGLASDPDFVLVFQRRFKMIKVNIPPKLVVFSNIQEIMKNEENFLAMITGRKTVINEEENFYNWNYEVPIVLTTRSLELVKYLFGNTLFNSKIMFVEIRGYIGNEKKKNELFDDIEAWFTKKTWESIRMFESFKMNEQDGQKSNIKCNQFNMREKTKNAISDK